MSEEIRSIANELLVVTSEEEEAEKAAEKVRDLVDAILADPSLSHLGLYEPPTPSSAPAGVALLRSSDPDGIDFHDGSPAGHVHTGPPSLGPQPDSGNHLVNTVRAAGHDSAHPNYKMAGLTHARVLPISYPRPFLGETPPPLPSGSESDVDVVVIDTGLVDPSPITPHVAGPTKPISTTQGLPTAELHGTFVAGIIFLAEPRANVTVDPMVNLNDDGFFSEWELACQIQSHVDLKPPEIINLSLGSLTHADEKPKALERAVNAAVAAGIHLFAAAGNDGPVNHVVYPAAFPNVYAVGGQVMGNGSPRPAVWSNASTTHAGVQFWAPGVSITSTTVIEANPITFRDETDFEPNAVVPTGQQDLPPNTLLNVPLSGWGCWDGTSVATPIVVAALATLLIDGDPDPLGELAAKFGSPTNTAGFSGTYAVATCGETPQPIQPAS